MEYFEMPFPLKKFVWGIAGDSRPKVRHLELMFRAGDPWLGGVPALRAGVTNGTTWGGIRGRERERLVMGSGNPDHGAKRTRRLGQ